MDRLSDRSSTLLASTIDKAHKCPWLLALRVFDFLQNLVYHKFYHKFCHKSVSFRAENPIKNSIDFCASLL